MDQVFTHATRRFCRRASRRIVGRKVKGPAGKNESRRRPPPPLPRKRGNLQYVTMIGHRSRVKVGVLYTCRPSLGQGYCRLTGGLKCKHILSMCIYQYDIRHPLCPHAKELTCILGGTSAGKRQVETFGPCPFLSLCHIGRMGQVDWNR